VSAFTFLIIVKWFPQYGIRTTQQREQGLRRSNRTTGDKKEEWIKIPVEASVCVEGSDPQTLDGFVYLSSENLRKS